MLCIPSLDQTHVQRQPGGLRELLEEACRQIAREAGDARLGQIHVGDEQRAARCFERNVRKSFVDRYESGCMTAGALSSIPIACALLMFYTNPDYVTFFFTDDVGQMMMGSAIGLQLIGYLIMRKIVNIEV